MSDARGGEMPPPRIYCIPATAAPIVAVFRRGPTNWSHLGAWNVEQGRYEPGGWLRGRIFPRRSDLSPDGRFLCYFAHKPGAAWEHGDAYVALSRLPWLTALYAFKTCGTWTRGYDFTEERSSDDPEISALPIRYGLRPRSVVQFAIERRRGWLESADSEARVPGDAWDQHRNARMEKRQPGGDQVLCVESVGWAGGEFGVDQAVDGLRVNYWLESGSDVQPLDHFQWADWDREGRLLAATRNGRLQTWLLRAGDSQLLFEEDLSAFQPDPSPPPAWAERW